MIFGTAFAVPFYLKNIKKRRKRSDALRSFLNIYDLTQNTQINFQNNWANVRKKL